MEELRDVYSHFMLYYGHEIPAMRLSKKKNPKDEEQEEGEETQEEEPEEKLKMPKRRDLYTICREAGMCWKSSLILT
jgi:transcription elongation factor SPT6